jgi:uncharacterized protein (TIGR01244 family)
MWDCDCREQLSLETQTMPQLNIVNFTALSNQVAGGGALSASLVAEMPAQGYTTIINLQHPKEDGVAEEEEAANGAELDYVNIPMGGLDFTYEQAQAVVDIVNDADGLVLIHCRSGARVSAIWALAQAIDQNLTSEQAADIARNHGCREIPESMVQRVVELINSAN